MQLGSYLPVYSQLIDLLTMQILDGTLTAGQALPLPAVLAVETGLNPRSVERAYQELADMGALQKRDDQMVVCDTAAELLRERSRERFCRRELPALARRMRLLGIDPAELDWQQAGQDSAGKDA